MDEDTLKFLIVLFMCAIFFGMGWASGSLNEADNQCVSRGGKFFRGECFAKESFK